MFFGIDEKYETVYLWMVPYQSAIRAVNYQLQEQNKLAYRNKVWVVKVVGDVS